MHTIGFQTFFVWAFKIIVDSWKFSILLLYILWDDWPIFMISASNEQLQQQVEYTLLKPDCHSWGISKMQFDTLEERYAIKFCFKLGKKPQKRMELFRLLLEHLAWTEHQFLSSMRDSRKAGSLWGMMRGVGGVRKSIYQSWLSQEFGLGLGLLCWGFKGVQEEIPSEESSRSVAFPRGQYTNPQLHPCHRLFDRDVDYLTEFLTVPIVQKLLPVTFGYSLSSEAVLMGQFRRWKRLWRRSLTLSHKRTAMGPGRICWNGTTSALLQEEITSKGPRVSCVYYQ